VSVRLRLLDKADKEIAKLDRPVKGAVWEFISKFRQDPLSHGLRFKQLRGDSRLYSARVTDDYRALLLHVRDEEYLLVGVKPRGEVYQNLDRYSYQINQVTGGIEFVDLPSIVESVRSKPQQTGPATLFAGNSDDELLDLGVAKPLLPVIRALSTEEQLLEFAECAPQLTVDVLFALNDGLAPDVVLEQVTAPVQAPGPVDRSDFAAAVERPATIVSTDDDALRVVLADDFARWQVFLHPVQRGAVSRSYNGPARVSGGPGTGKTIVALHRVKWLASRLPAGSGKPILLTTFTRNLAADLEHRLVMLGGPELLERVEVVNIDRLAAHVVAEARHGARPHAMGDDKAISLWEELLLELGESRWDAEFLNDEWSQVVLGHAIESRDEYFRARRVGRGRQLNRAQRAEIWRLVEQYTKRLEERNLWTFRRVAAAAARDEASRGPRYSHIVVDEAQDLSAAHWMMLRAMVASGPNDLFIAADSHQRIYDNYVSLSSLGIEIRGRSTRLTLTYRSTREILATAERLLGTAEWDDLDGGTDTLDGYRSVLRGPRPELHAYGSWPEELDAMVRHLKEWGSDVSVAVAVPERRQRAEVEDYLNAQGVRAAAIGSDRPRDHDAVHVGTLHGLKGLEYQRMILAGICDSAIPGARVEALRDSDPVRYQRELLRARSLLFVAATRARDSLVITWHGQPSRFLPQ
jgi:superfamily I DNA/RNA helicase/mRNA-degrading endonuclease RelE of RelBE toxin-antitoxin system